MDTNGVGDARNELDNQGNSITKLPRDILVCIATKVGSNSSASLVRLKATCKTLDDVTDDNQVLKHANVDGLGFSPSFIDQGETQFLLKCRLNSNLELLYTDGISVFFLDHKRHSTGLDMLHESAKDGYIRSMYAFGVIVLSHGTTNMRDAKVNDAVEYMRSLRESMKILICRSEVGHTLSNMRKLIHNDAIPVPRRMMCQQGLNGEASDGNHIEVCENCLWDAEVAELYKCLHLI